MLKTTDARQGITAYYYDYAGRKTAEVSPRYYNSSSTLSQMNRTEYVYDSMDRLITKKVIYYDTTTGQWITINSKSYKYDNSGNVIKELGASGYDAGTGTTDSQKIDTGYEIEYEYNLAGKITF